MCEWLDGGFIYLTKISRFTHSGIIKLGSLSAYVWMWGRGSTILTVARRNRQ